LAGDGPETRSFLIVVFRSGMGEKNHQAEILPANRHDRMKNAIDAIALLPLLPCFDFPCLPLIPPKAVLILSLRGEGSKSDPSSREARQPFVACSLLKRQRRRFAYEDVQKHP
jgi:hypothetical protein